MLFWWASIRHIYTWHVSLITAIYWKQPHIGAVHQLQRSWALYPLAPLRRETKLSRKGMCPESLDRILFISSSYVPDHWVLQNLRVLFISSVYLYKKLLWAYSPPHTHLLLPLSNGQTESLAILNFPISGKFDAQHVVLRRHNFPWLIKLFDTRCIINTLQIRTSVPGESTIIQFRGLILVPLWPLPRCNIR